MAPTGLSRPGQPPAESLHPEQPGASPAATASDGQVDSHDLLARAQGAVVPEGTFLPGEILADRFRIQRFIAQGGAGEVYEAEDLELRVRVALKVVRPEIAENEHAIERFRREIQLARQVTHPNVCRIFDVFRHDIPDSRPGRPPRRFLFLTMELLEGESLASLLHRQGPLTPEQALPIVRDMAAGLRAAHEAGVVHRDFKSANVVLVPRNGVLRAVITDFGLARSEVSPEAFSANITQSGTVVGTPTYMAPEQLTGGEITAAADVYSLGIVLFETITGRRPFKGETDLSTAVKRLTEAPPSPRFHVPELDECWERTILRCLERDPAKRYTDLGELVAHLETSSPAPSPESSPPRPAAPRPSPTTDLDPPVPSEEPSSSGYRSARSAWRGRPSAMRLLSLGGLLALAVASGFVLSRVTDPWKTPPPQLDVVGEGRSKVAVLEFKNLAGQRTDDWMAAALQEMVNMELAAGGHLQPVPSESVERVASELRSGDAGGLASETVSKLGQRLGASMMVDGSYLKNGSEIRLHLRLHTHDGPPVLLTVPGSDDQLFDLVSRAGAELRSRLGLGEYLGKVEAFGDSVEAEELYARGVAELHRFDGEAARQHFAKAVSADPLYAEAYAGLAASLDLLGHEDEARRASRRALDLSAPLARELKLAIEANDSLVRDNVQRAIDLYGSLYRFFPDNLEYGLGLVHALIAGGRGGDALEILESLRQLPAADDVAPRLDLVEARAAGASGEPERQLASARRVVATVKESEAPLLVAEGHLLEARALIELGSDAAGEAVAGRARRLFEEANERRGTSDALRVLSLVARRRGDEGAAERLAREADELERELASEELVGQLEGVGSVARAGRFPAVAISLPSAVL